MSEILEYNYQEMVRLAEKCDALIKSSFDDFKLLGALGILLAWKPVEEQFIANPQITLYGFLAIAVITTLISLFDLLKQSLVMFYLKELQTFETKVRDALAEPETPTFRVAEHWQHWSRLKQRPIAKRFYALFYLVLIGYPTIALFPSWLGMVLYCLSAIGLVAIHYNSTQVLYASSRLDA